MPKSDTTRKSAQLNIRLGQLQREALTARAKQADLTLNAYCLRLLFPRTLPDDEQFQK